MSGIVLRCRALKVVNKRPGVGTDYAVFVCPACGTRCKRAMYASLTGGVVSFRCHGCRREVELEKPAPPAPLLVDPQGRAIGRRR